MPRGRYLFRQFASDIKARPLPRHKRLACPWCLEPTFGPCPKPECRRKAEEASATLSDRHPPKERS